MSLIDTLLAAALPAIHATAGDAATYTAPNGSPVACSVVFAEMSVTEYQADGAEVTRRAATIAFRSDQIAAPEVDGRVTIAAGGFAGTWILRACQGRSLADSVWLAHASLADRAQAAGVKRRAL